MSFSSDQSGVENEKPDAIGAVMTENEESEQRKMRASLESDPQVSCKIALLTPYDGGNLGDAAIQDSLIANLRTRLPEAQFSAISLSGESFAERHGVIETFPLCATERPFYGMARQSISARIKHGESSAADEAQNANGAEPERLRSGIKALPIVGPILKGIRNAVVLPVREIRHAISGYRFLRTQDLLIVSGGGQFDEEWGGSWGHPFALFKWTLLARMARIPCAIPSVGTGRANSKSSRWLMSAALRMAQYRSYRDLNSKNVATKLEARAAGDSIVADLALSMPASEMPAAGKVRSISQGRKVIAISPIAYGKPGKWPNYDRTVYDRYVGEMVRAIANLISGGYFLVIVCSSLGDDDRVILEILDQLDEGVKKKLPEQVYVPAITTWQDLIASLMDADVLIASRLHSVILGFVTDTPSIAISFNPKVNWVMEDFGQTNTLFDIHQFTAENIVEAVGLLEVNRHQVTEQIQLRRRELFPASEVQYDALAGLAKTGYETHRQKSAAGAVNHAG